MKHYRVIVTKTIDHTVIIRAEGEVEALTLSMNYIQSNWTTAPNIVTDYAFRHTDLGVTDYEDVTDLYVEA